MGTEDRWNFRFFVGLFRLQVGIVERRSASQQMVKRATQAVDVRPNVDTGRFPLLGRHVHAGPHRPLVEPCEPVLLVGGEKGQAEVEDLDEALSVSGWLGGGFVPDLPLARRPSASSPATSVSIRLEGLMSR